MLVVFPQEQIHMIQNKTLLSAAEFIEKLVGDKISIGQTLTVQDDVRLDGKKIVFPEKKFQKGKINSIRFENINFMGAVTIENFEHLSLSSRNTNFLKGLSVDRCSGTHASLSGGKMESLKFWGCTLGTVCLRDLEVTRYDLELAWLKLEKGLELSGIMLARNLVIQSDKDSEWFLKTPYVRTDDPALALQFRLAGIPVFMSSEAVRDMMKAHVEEALFI